MKTALLILLTLIAAAIALKLLPLAFAILAILALPIVLCAAAGMGILAIALGVVLGTVALLSPIWIPALALVGLIVLLRKLVRGSNGSSAAPS